METKGKIAMGLGLLVLCGLIVLFVLMSLGVGVFAGLRSKTPTTSTTPTTSNNNNNNKTVPLPPPVTTSSTDTNKVTTNPTPPSTPTPPSDASSTPPPQELRRSVDIFSDFETRGLKGTFSPALDTWTPVSITVGSNGMTSFALTPYTKLFVKFGQAEWGYVNNTASSQNINDLTREFGCSPTRTNMCLTCFLNDGNNFKLDNKDKTPGISIKLSIASAADIPTPYFRWYRSRYDNGLWVRTGDKMTGMTEQTTRMQYDNVTLGPHTKLTLYSNYYFEMKDSVVPLVLSNTENSERNYPLYATPYKNDHWGGTTWNTDKVRSWIIERA
jgi:hypothetical protein